VVDRNTIEYVDFRLETLEFDVREPFCGETSPSSGALLRR
jgi:hypothetical protein